MKVTPAHDPNDFALGQRHHLPSINVMDDTAHINAEGGAYAGLDRFVARKKIVADLEEQGLLAGIKDHMNNVGHCDRCKTVVEPRLSLQWFVKIQPLADKAIAAVKDGHIKFTPEMYEKTYLNWMENIHDWCISRQLWWGHRIPAWHCAVCHKITVAREDPAACAHCGSEKITQETDVLDTWFSSGLLPVSVFGWPNITAENRADFDAFYPTSLLVTGFDILFFWVARMIMLGCWFAGDVPLPDGQRATLADSVPFREVYIHALVRDANRREDVEDQGQRGRSHRDCEAVWDGCGAVHAGLDGFAGDGYCVQRGADGGVSGVCQQDLECGAVPVYECGPGGGDWDSLSIGALLGGMPAVDDDAPLEARWIVSELWETAAKVNLALENYRFDDAANTIYQFFWGSFCDWYLEIVKLRLDFSETTNKATAECALTTLVQVFEASLRLLSPFMPFLTEEIWHAIHDGNPPAKSIGLAKYPFGDDSMIDKSAKHQMQHLQSIVSGIREVRKDRGVPEKEIVSAYVLEVASYGIDSSINFIEENRSWVEKLSRSRITKTVNRDEHLNWRSVGPTRHRDRLPSKDRCDR